ENAFFAGLTGKCVFAGLTEKCVFAVLAEKCVLRFWRKTVSRFWRENEFLAVLVGKCVFSVLAEKCVFYGFGGKMYFLRFWRKNEFFRFWQENAYLRFCVFGGKMRFYGFDGTMDHLGEQTNSTLVNRIEASAIVFRYAESCTLMASVFKLREVRVCFFGFGPPESDSLWPPSILLRWRARHAFSLSHVVIILYESVQQSNQNQMKINQLVLELINWSNGSCSRLLSFGIWAKVLRLKAEDR
ncbi:unnamed protein product, partial [Brassica oleracea var. botrytis]